MAIDSSVHMHRPTIFVAGIEAHGTYSVIAIVSNTGQLVARPPLIKNTEADFATHGRRSGAAGPLA